MWVYFGFIAVLLITNEEKHIKKVVSSTNYGTKYKNSNNNEIQVNSYCESRNCVLRCCPNGKDLNSEGTCEESSLIKNNQFINVYKWSKEPRETKVTKNTKVYKAPAENDQMSHFYILEHGFLKAKLKNNTREWLGADPLDFCVNSHFAALMNKENLAFIFKVTEDSKTDAETNTDHTFKYIAAGMILGIVLFGLIAYRMSAILRRLLSLVLLAFIFTLTAAYITITVQVLALRAGIVTSTDCRIISPIVYFFVLSTFFWLNVMSFDVWWTMRNFRKYSIKINNEVDSGKFIRICIYSWVIPFLMTAAAVFVDILKLDLILPFVRPPFDSCLTNDIEMLLYLYIPIILLTATKGLFYVMNLYNIWRLQRKYDNILDIINIMISKHRYGVRLKLWTIITVSGMLLLIPNVPKVILYTINAYNILIGSALYILFLYERYTYDLPYFSYDYGDKFMELYRRATGAATTRSTVGTVIMGDNSEALEGRNSMSAQIITTENVENNRF